MALTIEEVRKIAALARLRFTPEEEAVYVGQLGRIVDYIDQLQGFETAEEGTGQSAPEAAPEAEDRARETLPRELFLANAPASLDGFLLVPVVKGSSPDGDDLA